MKKLRRSKFFWIFAVCCFVFGMYSTYIPNGFVWLDHGDIENRRAVVTQPLGILTTRFGDTAFYRPLVTLFHTVDFLLYGNWSWGYHLTNVILQSAVVLLIFLVGYQAVRLSYKSALLAAIVFGVHPVGMLPVGVISYRPELLLSIGVLTSLWWLGYGNRFSRIIYSAVLFILILAAFFAKETAVIVLPLVSLLYTFYAKKILNVTIPWKQLLMVLVSGLSLYGIMRFQAVSQQWKSTYPLLTFSEHLSTRVWVLSRQLMTIISPLPLPISDAVPVVPLTSYTILFLIGGIFIVLLLLNKIKNAQQRFLILCAGISLLPALNIVPLPRLQSVHYAYLPTIFCALFISQWLITLRYFKKIFFVGLVVWVAIAAITTVSQGQQFQNDYTLFSAETHKDEQFREGWFYLGRYYAEKKEFLLAEAAYEKSLDKNPQVIAYLDEMAARLNLAGVKLGLQKYAEAETLLASIPVANDEQKAQIAYNRALMAWQHTEYEKVIQLLRPFTATWNISEPNFLLAQALIQTEQYSEAISVLKTALPFVSPDKKLEVFKLLQELALRKEFKSR